MHSIEKWSEMCVCECVVRCALLNTIRHLTNRHVVNTEMNHCQKKEGARILLKIQLWLWVDLGEYEKTRAVKIAYRNIYYSDGTCLNVYLWQAQSMINSWISSTISPKKTIIVQMPHTCKFVRIFSDIYHHKWSILLFIKVSIRLLFNK